MFNEFFSPYKVKMMFVPFYYENSGIVFQRAQGKTEAFGNDDAYIHVCFLNGLIRKPAANQTIGFLRIPCVCEWLGDVCFQVF